MYVRIYVRIYVFVCVDKYTKAVTRIPITILYGTNASTYRIGISIGKRNSNTLIF